MKKGANFHDKKQIERWAEAGKTAEEISQLLSIDQTCVESFMPKKRKRRTKAEMEADAVAEAEE